MSNADSPEACQLECQRWPICNFWAWGQKSNYDGDYDLCGIYDSLAPWHGEDHPCNHPSHHCYRGPRNCNSGKDKN